MPLKVFIDTEFTDFAHPHLISLGMAAESGEVSYVEVPYPDKECSDFVRESVIPLLGRIPNSTCSNEELRNTIITWLNIVRNRDEDVEICVDYQTDWDLFVNALDYRVPPWCHMRMVATCINELLRYEFHDKNQLPEHHALYDAMANRYAFRERENSQCD